MKRSVPNDPRPFALDRTVLNVPAPANSAESRKASGQHGEDSAPQRYYGDVSAATVSHRQTQQAHGR